MAPMALTSTSNLERVPAHPLPFGRFLELDPLYSRCPFKPWLFLIFLGSSVSRAGMGQGPGAH